MNGICYRLCHLLHNLSYISECIPSLFLCKHLWTDMKLTKALCKSKIGLQFILKSLFQVTITHTFSNEVIITHNNIYAYLFLSHCFSANSRQCTCFFSFPTCYFHNPVSYLELRDSDYFKGIQWLLKLSRDLSQGIPCFILEF